MANEVNKIDYGFCSVYYAKATAGENGTLSYGTPVRIPGGVNLSLSAEGERNVFYADNIEFFVDAANNGYTGTLEVAMLPDSFYTDILGDTTTDGVTVEHADVAPAEFALLFECWGDQKKTRHALFRCTCSRPALSAATKEENIEPQTYTVDITAMPRINDYVVKARAGEDATAYATWFTAVPTVS